MRWKKNGMKRVTAVKNGIRFHRHRVQWSSTGPSSEAIKMLCQSDFNIGARFVVVRRFVLSCHFYVNYTISSHCISFSIACALSLSHFVVFHFVLCTLHASNIECLMFIRVLSILAFFSVNSVKVEHFPFAIHSFAIFHFSKCSIRRKIYWQFVIIVIQPFRIACNPSMDNKLN